MPGNPEQSANLGRSLWQPRAALAIATKGKRPLYLIEWHGKRAGWRGTAKGWYKAWALAPCCREGAGQGQPRPGHFPASRVQQGWGSHKCCSPAWEERSHFGLALQMGAMKPGADLRVVPATLCPVGQGWARCPGGAVQVSGCQPWWDGTGREGAEPGCCPVPAASQNPNKSGPPPSLA